MKVLIACEYSGVVSQAFRDKGHNAISCDFLENELTGRQFHYKGNVLDILDDGWDLVIAHPPCTYLCNSGVRWLYNKDKSINQSRWDNMYEAANFFKQFVNRQTLSKVCIENPIPHSYADLPPYSQIIQPWQFGHGETKATCLWLYGLPLLEPTNVVSGREHRIHELPPSKDRGKLRSKTYEGVAKAMADQWG